MSRLNCAVCRTSGFMVCCNYTADFGKDLSTVFTHLNNINFYLFCYWTHRQTHHFCSSGRTAFAFNNCGCSEDKFIQLSMETTCHVFNSSQTIEPSMTCCFHTELSAHLYLLCCEITPPPQPHGKIYLTIISALLVFYALSRQYCLIDFMYI